MSLIFQAIMISICINIAQTDTVTTDSSRTQGYPSTEVSTDNGNRISIDENAYDRSLEAILSINDHMKRIIDILLVVIGLGGVVGIFQKVFHTRQVKKYRSDLDSAEETLKEAQIQYREKCDEVNAKRKELEDNVKAAEELMTSFEKTITKLQITAKKAKTDADESEKRIQGLVISLEPIIDDISNKNWSNIKRSYAQLTQRMTNTADDWFNQANWFHQRGKELARKKKFELALDSYRKSVDAVTKAIKKYGSTNPIAAVAYTSRGSTNKELSRYEDALRDHSKAIELDPELAGAYINRGNIYYQLKQNENAFDDYEHAIELEPDEGIVYSNRGGILGEMGEFDKALEDIEKALELKPNFSGAYDNRAYIQVLMAKSVEDNEKRITLLNKAKRDSRLAIHNSSNTMGFYNLACAEVLLGEKVNAYKHLKEAVDRRKVTIVEINKGSEWDQYRDDPEFNRIIQQLPNDVDSL